MKDTFLMELNYKKKLSCGNRRCAGFFEKAAVAAKGCAGFSIMNSELAYVDRNLNVWFSKLRELQSCEVPRFIEF
jgi:hypothetical protein